jgi:hypothetical protein
MGVTVTDENTKQERPIIKHYDDGQVHCVSYQYKGKAPIIKMYLDRRAAITFPSVYNKGYFCLFGIPDQEAVTGKYKLKLLLEYSEESQDKFFMKVVSGMRLYSCNMLYALCNQENESKEADFSMFLARYNIKRINLFDASEFDGYSVVDAGFEAARAPVDEYGRRGLLDLPKKSQMRMQLQTLQVPDFKIKPQRAFPAVNALNHIMMSFMLSPYKKPKPDKEASGSYNIEGYGG